MSSSSTGTASLLGSTRTLNGTPLWGLDTINCDFDSSHLYCLQQ
jgi:hypothetical protein